MSGVLLADGTIDRERTAELVELARPLPFTFHRAFDVARDRNEALDTLIDLGIERVLTSGGAVDALAAADTIAALVERAAGRIVVMPGGGVEPNNVLDLVRRTGVSEVHTSASVTVESGMSSRNANPRMGAEGTLGEYELVRTDELVVRACIDALAGG